MNRPISRLKTNLLLWFAVAVPLLLSGPLSMFTSNYGDFDLGAQQLAWTLLPALWIVLGLAAATALLPWQHAVQLTLAWIALSLYVQGNFLVWDYGRFDGTEIPWQEYGYRGIVDCGVWFALLGMVVFFRRAILKDATLILGGLSLLQIGTSVAGFARSSAPMEMKVSVDSGDSLYSFSKDRNVLFLLLDEFSSRGFYQLLKADPDVKREFADFTFYRDIISAFPTTYAAVPAILTGRPAPRSGSMQASLKLQLPSQLTNSWASPDGLRQP